MNVKKVALCSNIYYQFNQVSGAKECLIIKNGDEHVRPMNTNAVKKYFVKIKSSISRKLEKAA